MNSDNLKSHLYCQTINSTVCLHNTHFRWYYGYIYLYL